MSYLHFQYAFIAITFFVLIVVLVLYLVKQRRSKITTQNNVLLKPVSPESTRSSPQRNTEKTNVSSNREKMYKSFGILGETKLDSALKRNTKSDGPWLL